MTVGISCGNLVKTVTKRNVMEYMDARGDTKLIDNFFGPNWLPEDYVDEEGNLTFLIKYTGKGKAISNQCHNDSQHVSGLS